MNRNILWNILRKNGVSGKIFNVLIDMYRSVRYCVRGFEGHTDFFECSLGLKQGCKLSPILFSYLISSLAEEISAHSKHGVQILTNTQDISALLFADDVALL